MFLYDIAELVGITDARKVGWALRGNTDPKIPCHRVVKKDGFIAKGYAFGDWRIQKERLEKEGVKFLADDQIDLPSHHWNY